MVGFTTVPNVLGIIGGSPILKAGRTIIENLKAAKSVDGGDLGGLLSKVLQNGIGAVLKNPLANIAALVNSTAAQAITKLESFWSPDTTTGSGDSGTTTVPDPDRAAFTAAIGNLTSAVTSITGAAAVLSGVNAGDGLGFLNVLSHSGTTSMLGSNLPGGLGLPVVLGPLNADTTLATVQADIDGIPDALIAGDITLQQALDIINGHAAGLNQTKALSDAAQAAVQNMSLAFAMVSAAGACIHSTDPNILAILPKIIQPDALIAMQQAAADMVDPDK